MIRINILVEGDTEEVFVRDVLSSYMNRNGYRYQIGYSKVITSRKRGKVYKGGGNCFAKIKNHLLNWMKSDINAFYTTMFDLYAFPDDIPGFDSIRGITSPFDKVNELEKLLANQVLSEHCWKFIPYIQLHEFEAMIFSNPMQMSVFFIEDRFKSCIRELNEIAMRYDSPEHINEGIETAPSKRIINAIKEYDDLKPVAGPQIVDSIGIDSIRQKCIHFDDWLKKLEELATINET
ncbi:MAG: DUF4276 family protein [Ruminiclostridium sp.]|nr:DUF4276 family protein [Ruminiclostridium sp.]